MGRRRKEQASQDAVEVFDAEAVDAAADALNEIEAEILADSAPAESHSAAEYHEEVPVKAPTKWVVLEDQNVSLFGQVTLLPAGTVVSAASYGPAGIKRIMEQGVLLEPVG
jgi:hypothetical protein